MHVESEVITIRIDVTETLLTMFTTVLIAWPLRLQLKNDVAIKLCSIVKRICGAPIQQINQQTWDLSKHENVNLLTTMKLIIPITRPQNSCNRL